MLRPSTPNTTRFIQASWDVHHLAPTLKAALFDNTQWNYITHNGPTSIFSGYAWSLDTFVDYAWSSLGQLKTVLIILLIVETICVQVTCMMLLTWLVRVRAPAVRSAGG